MPDVSRSNAFNGAHHFNVDEVKVVETDKSTKTIMNGGFHIVNSNRYMSGAVHNHSVYQGNSDGSPMVVYHNHGPVSSPAALQRHFGPAMRVQTESSRRPPYQSHPRSSQSHAGSRQRWRGPAPPSPPPRPSFGRSYPTQHSQRSFQGRRPYDQDDDDYEEYEGQYQDPPYHDQDYDNEYDPRYQDPQYDGRPFDDQDQDPRYQGRSPYDEGPQYQATHRTRTQRPPPSPNAYDDPRDYYDYDDYDSDENRGGQYRNGEYPPPPSATRGSSTYAGSPPASPREFGASRMGRGRSGTQDTMRTNTSSGTMYATPPQSPPAGSTYGIEEEEQGRPRVDKGKSRMRYEDEEQEEEEEFGRETGAFENSDPREREESSDCGELNAPAPSSIPEPPSTAVLAAPPAPAVRAHSGSPTLAPTLPAHPVPTRNEDSTTHHPTRARTSSSNGHGHLQPQLEGAAPPHVAESGSRSSLRSSVGSTGGKEKGQDHAKEKKEEKHKKRSSWLPSKFFAKGSSKDLGGVGTSNVDGRESPGDGGRPSVDADGKKEGKRSSFFGKRK